MKNHFKIFNLEIAFNIDLNEVEQKYLQSQKEFHPDNSELSDIEKSMALNEAYEILNSPIKRASHILQLNNIDLEDDEKAPRPNLETLEEILDLQEKVTEIKLEEITNLKKYLDVKIAEILELVANDLKIKNFSQAAQNLMKVKYFDKTLKDLKNKKRKSR